MLNFNQTEVEHLIFTFYSLISIIAFLARHQYDYLSAL